MQFNGRSVREMLQKAYLVLKIKAPAGHERFIGALVTSTVNSGQMLILALNRIKYTDYCLCKIGCIHFSHNLLPNVVRLG